MQAAERTVDEGYGGAGSFDEEDIVATAYCAIEGCELCWTEVARVVDFEVGRLEKPRSEVPFSHNKLEGLEVILRTM